MVKQTMIVFLIACLTLAAIGGTPKPPVFKPPNLPDPRSLRGLIDDEKKEALRKYFDDYFLQRRISSYEYLSAMAREAMKNELRVNEGQWRIIEPKYKRQIKLMWNSWARASHKVGKDFSWIKPTEDMPGRPRPKTAAELTETERNVEKLIDLLRREDSNDEELRKEIDALQQAREKARKEWPKAKRELAATLTTPRQEAVFLLLGYID